ncbi:DNA-protecting protein DprA [Siculibacillus lacustris]|uniref:DNA-protecting protein DprA n=1 Tax=Siculibacillus lacustris TaxID=1549641 RepID=A0A4Q9VH89_9HYPH|nr:DNA-processing protein DprA [Siculibacillus lacustris]TBW34318.1 DNA-protecting protein DprA [Siculibacillus lacustris]
MSNATRAAWLRLIRSENVGPVTFRQLVDHFGSAVAALEALPDLARRGGARARIRVASEAEVAEELATARALGAHFVAMGEPDYPVRLAVIEGPPPILAVKGGSGVCRRPAVAIVGARNASLAGRKFAGQMARGLGLAGFVVASGLARGIDAAAHEASLDTGTIAVFAGGLDRLYPPENENLAARIVATGGALVSEMPFGWEPRARDFPRRNRLISGLALGVVVIEAAARSGSLHTARFAAEQGREVFAVPGSPLDPRTEGTNDLIRNGATLVAAPEHVIEALAPILGQAPPPSQVSEGAGDDLDRPTDASDLARRVVLEALGPTPVGVDEILRATGVRTGELQLILMELAIAGRLERHAGGRVSLLP